MGDFFYSFDFLLFVLNTRYDDNKMTKRVKAFSVLVTFLRSLGKYISAVYTKKLHRKVIDNIDFLLLLLLYYCSFLFYFMKMRFFM